MKTATSLDRGRIARVLLVCALGLAAFAVQAQGPLRTITVRIGPHPVKVEVADSDPARERGLMHRTSMPRDEGMLFVFDELAYHSMWMKNTLIPLSVAFIDPQGVILNIPDMEPQTLDSHMAAGPALYAIEMNKGWFAANKVKAGDKVTGLPKPKAQNSAR